jgi:hypothetical protein
MWGDIPENGEDFGFDLNGSFFGRNGLKNRKFWR